MGIASRILGLMIIGCLGLGVILMALAESVLQEAFGIGLILFCIGIGISAILGIWSSAGWMERQSRKYFD